MNTTNQPHCPYCNKPAVLVTGAVIYPHRPDLFALKFWQCAPCKAHVGCHKSGAVMRVGNRKVTSDGTVPLGRLANAQLRQAKSAAHAAFAPLWRAGGMQRREAYAWLADQLGITVANCHIGEFDIEGCRAVVTAVAAYRMAA